MNIREYVIEQFLGLMEIVVPQVAGPGRKLAAKFLASRTGSGAGHLAGEVSKVSRTAGELGHAPASIKSPFTAQREKVLARVRASKPATELVSAEKVI